MDIISIRMRSYYGIIIGSFYTSLFHLPISHNIVNFPVCLEFHRHITSIARIHKGGTYK